MTSVWTELKMRIFAARFLHMVFFDGVTKSFGVIVMTVVQQSGLQYWTVGWIFSWQMTVCYATAPLVSMLLQYRSRRFWAVLAGFLVGLGYTGLSFVIRQTFWLMLLMTSLSGLGLSFLHLITVISLKDTFGDSYSTAYALSSLGTNVGVSLFPLLLEYLSRNYGTRGGVLVFGAFLWNTIIVGLLIRTTRYRDGSTHEEIGEDDCTSAVQDVQSHTTCNSVLPLRIFLLHPNFIFLFITSVLIEANFVAWATYLVPYGQFLGYPSHTAVFLSSIGGVSGLVGKVFVTLISYLDCLHPMNIIVIPSLLIALSYTATFLWTSFTALAITSCVSGFCIGLQGSGRFSMMGSVVCAKHFKLAVAWSYSGYALSALVGGIVTGYVRDVTGSFQYAFSFLVAICLLEMFVGLVWCCFSLTRWANDKADKVARPIKLQPTCQSAYHQLP